MNRRNTEGKSHGRVILPIEQMQIMENIGQQEQKLNTCYLRRKDEYGENSERECKGVSEVVLQNT